MRGSMLMSLLVAASLVACGGGTEEEGTMETDTMAMEADTDMAPEAGALSTPSWMTYDPTAMTASLEIAAGESDVNNRWNFNGLYAGMGKIVIPQGTTVTINFTNADPAQPHSLGIEEWEATWPAIFENVEPAFAGAITPDAATSGTAPSGTASITFTADAAGDYAMVCYIAGHAVAGMVVPFTVSADGTVGVQQ